MKWKNTVDNKEANWNRMKTAEKMSIRSQFWNGDNGKHETKFGLVRMPQKQQSVSSVSEVVRFFPTTQELQMRGGADTDEERDAPPKPQATLVVFHWVNTVSSKACGSAAAGLVQQRGTRSFRKKKKKKIQTAKLWFVKVQNWCSLLLISSSGKQERVWRMN